MGVGACFKFHRQRDLNFYGEEMLIKIFIHEGFAFVKGLPDWLDSYDTWL